MKIQLCINEKLIFVCMGCQILKENLNQHKKSIRISQENWISSIRLKDNQSLTHYRKLLLYNRKLSPYINIASVFFFFIKSFSFLFLRGNKRKISIWGLHQRQQRTAVFDCPVKCDINYYIPLKLCKTRNTFYGIKQQRTFNHTFFKLEISTMMLPSSSKRCCPLVAILEISGDSIHN